MAKTSEATFLRRIAGVGVALALLLLPATGTARPFRMAGLPDAGAAFQCAVCHVTRSGGGPRTPFGRDWEKLAMPAERYTEALGARDSDGDGFSNDVEFREKTNPGDPASKPGKAAP